MMLGIEVLRPQVAVKINCETNEVKNSLKSFEKLKKKCLQCIMSKTVREVIIHLARRYVLEGE